jgi:superfamily I DNA/RNA helicase
VVLELDINCRNTRRIVAFATNAAHILTEPSELAPLGRPPRMIVAPSQAAIAGLVQNEIRRLLEDHRLRPDQIVLIGPTAWKNGCLGRWSSIAGAKLTDSAAEWRSGGVILSTTARRFKGLEADVVILYDLHGIGPLFTKSDLYVALTRARSHIVLVTQSSDFANQLQAAVIAVTAIGQEPELA